MSDDKSRWRDYAACRGTDPELFFPLSESGSSQLQIWQATQVCNACSVQWTCLAWALQNGVTYGIWGGSTESVRRELLGDLADRMRRPCPAPRGLRRPGRQRG
jgi:WhiB family redox-sensing transcriptional regulator